MYDDLEPIFLTEEELPDCLKPYKPLLEKYGHPRTELEMGDFIHECSLEDYYELVAFGQAFDGEMYKVVHAWSRQQGGIVESAAARAAYYAASLAVTADDDRIWREKEGLGPR
jgi:hypothetical protein